MKILQVITAIPKAAGTSTFCGELCNQLVAMGHDITLAVCNPDERDVYPLDPCIKLVSIGSIINPPPRPTISTFSLVHIHCLWLPILHQVSNWTRAQRIPVIWSTHGMTAPWAMHHKWWKKFIPWHLYQKRDLKRARLIHCTSGMEEKWNHALGLKRTVIVPLGTFLPSVFNIETQRHRERVLLYVGRIYPVKALDNLIKAFAHAIDSFHSGRARPMSATPANVSQWTLRLVGPDEAGHLSELKKLADSLRLCDSVLKIEFPGPKYGADLKAEYENCSALALVSHSENFGATVVDAMAHGKPVITSTNTPWKIVAGGALGDRALPIGDESRCGWWVDNDAETLTNTIRELFSKSPYELDAMGRNGRALVESRFTWQAVAKAMEAAYEDAQRNCEFAPCGACEKCYDTCSPEHIIKY